MLTQLTCRCLWTLCTFKCGGTKMNSSLIINTTTQHSVLSWMRQTKWLEVRQPMIYAQIWKANRSICKDSPQQLFRLVQHSIFWSALAQILPPSQVRMLAQIAIITPTSRTQWNISRQRLATIHNSITPKNACTRAVRWITSDTTQPLVLNLTWRSTNRSVCNSKIFLLQAVGSRHSLITSLKLPISAMISIMARLVRPSPSLAISGPCSLSNSILPAQCSIMTTIASIWLSWSRLLVACCTLCALCRTTGFTNCKTTHLMPIWWWCCTEQRKRTMLLRLDGKIGI